MHIHSFQGIDMKPRPFSRKRTRASRLRLTSPLGLLPSLLVGSCSSSIDPDAEEVVLTIVSGDGQVGVQGTELSQPITVRVPRGREEPFAGIRVEAVPGPGSGQLMDQVVTTDAQGRAHFRWVLGDAWFNTLSGSPFPTTEVTEGKGSCSGLFHPIGQSSPRKRTMAGRLHPSPRWAWILKR